MNTIKIAHFQIAQLFFLLSSLLFFLMAIVVGLGGIENAQEKSLSTQVELKELKHRQTYFIVLAFMFALFLDLLGLILLAAFSF
jgi:TRAP-type C4-dicarboxylate transport system permease small subunit